MFFLRDKKKVQESLSEGFHCTLMLPERVMDTVEIVRGWRFSVPPQPPDTLRRDSTEDPDTGSHLQLEHSWPPVAYSTFTNSSLYAKYTENQEVLALKSNISLKGK